MYYRTAAISVVVLLHDFPLAGFFFFCFEFFECVQPSQSGLEYTRASPTLLSSTSVEKKVCGELNSGSWLDQLLETDQIEFLYSCHHKCRSPL